MWTTVNLWFDRNDSSTRNCTFFNWTDKTTELQTSDNVKDDMRDSLMNMLFSLTGVHYD